MTVTVYNRPAVVEGRFGTTVRVRYRDNGTLGYVPADEIDE
jgi:hypothetical protein